MTDVPDGLDPGRARGTAAVRAGSARRRRVVVFRREFLKISETFVRDHVLSLQRYEPVVVARQRVAGLEVPGVEVIPAWDTSRQHWLLSRVGRRARRVPPVARALMQVPVDRTLRDVGPDLVHAHFGPDAELVRPACRRYRIPLVVTFHGYDVTVSPRELRASNEVLAHYARHRRRLFQHAARIITVSQFLAGRLVEQGAPPEKVTVIPAGVDTRRFQPAPPALDGPVLFVGRLVEKKGCLDLVHAMARVPREERRDLVIVGDGPLRPRLEAAARDLGVPVRFLGPLDPEAVREQYRRARFVAIPSRTAGTGDQEGLPVVSLETGATGRAAVAAEHSGLPEAVLDDQTGIVYREGSVAALTRAIRRLSTDDDLVIRFGREARAHVEQRFDIRRMTEKVESVYDDVLDPAGAGS